MKTNIFTNFHHNKTFISTTMVFCLAISLVCPLEAKEYREAFDVFKNIVEMRKLEASAISSVEVEYQFKQVFEGFTGDTIPIDVIKKCNFGRMGDKFYISETQQIPNTSDIITRSVTFDGLFARRRDSAAWKNIMMLGQSDDARKLTTPEPSQLIEPHSVQELHDAVSRGELEVVSAESTEVNGENCVKVVFDVLRRDFPAGKAEIYYSTERGYWPILIKSYKSDGTLLAEVRNIELAKVVTSGNEVFYPLGGEWKVYGEEGKLVTRSLNVNKKSLKVNEPIPDSKFTMTLGRDEMLYDMELGIQIVDPGKKIDLSVLDAPRVATKKLKDSGVKPAAQPQSRIKLSKNSPKPSIAEISLPAKKLEQITINFKVLFGIIFLAVLIIICTIFYRKLRKQQCSNLPKS